MHESTQSSSPAVTVAICTFNRADTLRLTLERLRELEIPADLVWEVLVIDNASTDNTPAVLEAMAGQLPLRSARESTTGKSFALNLALKEARGTFILWTDDDALVDRQWLVRMLATFERTGADFIFGRVVPAWPGDKEPNWYSPRVSGLFALLDYGDEAYISTDPDQAPNGVNFAGRLSSHHRVGDYRVDFGPKGSQGGGGLAEDYDIYTRALALNMKVVYQPDVVVRHMIAEARATKMFNWKKALLNQHRFYGHLIENPEPVPWFLGLPRYYYRKMISDVGGLIWAFLKGDKPARFYYELHVLRFTGLFTQSLRNGFPRQRGLAAKRV